MSSLCRSVITADLKEGGADVLVNQENKQEYVDLYADFLLNTCVEKQFLAFQVKNNEEKVQPCSLSHPDLGHFREASTW
jgi:hypothetical protein